MFVFLQGNVRGLLGSLQTVLWQDSNWKPIGMGDLLEPAQVSLGSSQHTNRTAVIARVADLATQYQREWSVSLHQILVHH